MFSISTDQIRLVDVHPCIYGDAIKQKFKMLPTISTYIGAISCSQVTAIKFDRPKKFVIKVGDLIWGSILGAFLTIFKRRFT